MLKIKKIMVFRAKQFLQIQQNKKWENKNNKNDHMYTVSFKPDNYVHICSARRRIRWMFKGWSRKKFKQKRNLNDVSSLSNRAKNINDWKDNSSRSIIFVVVEIPI